MSKRIFRIPGEPLLDLVSHGRGGLHGIGSRLTPAQVEQIRHTVRRAPEVVVKVLPRDSNSLKAAGKHLDYIGRYGELELETDDGEHRSKVEIVADEIGPSLRFATADVRRTMRSTPGEQESTGSDDTEVSSL